MILLETLLSIQPRTSSGGGKSADDVVKETFKVIQSKTPKKFDYESIFAKFPTEYSESMNTVLIQEVIKYNVLIDIMQINLKNLDKALSDPSIIPFLFFGYHIENKELTMKGTIKLDDIINNTFESDLKTPSSEKISKNPMRIALIKVPETPYHWYFVPRTLTSIIVSPTTARSVQRTFEDISWLSML